MDREEVRRLVRREVEAAFSAAPGGEPETGRAERPPPLDFVSAREVETAHRAGARRIEVAARGIVTPLARDAAASHRIEIAVAPAAREHPEAGPAREPAVRRIAVAADHGGYALKERIARRLETLGFEVEDLGTSSPEAVDYPEFAYRVAREVASGACQRGIVVDGIGIASAIVANKVAGIRATPCQSLSEAKSSRDHNDANVLTLGGKLLGEGLALEMVELWLSTPFGGGRHARRVEQIAEIERREGRS